MSKSAQIVEALRHSRHDWLNQLQLIKGYMALERYDRMNDVIEEIIQQAHQDSKISSLNAPVFAERLLTFNWHNHPYQLAYECLLERSDLSDKEAKIVRILNEGFIAFDKSSQIGEDNHLLLVLKDLDHLTFEWDFHGRISSFDEIECFIERVTTKETGVKCKEKQFMENEIFVSLEIGP
ncbi:Spo0B C-terminal domain-containing protein [Texcoconibacillus texcoconensis]|uniref:Stage 0 sporulation protein B (Sporulation initiation phosphotransferase) n=1 Tax=Texcoconibacillus texcoconensis TaxID=1095777 RepID=A0A840QPA0_9BACI|nr:Spo0B C-terminal domain-containing protein [Texcoconibacillus texcoconensis]MBB5173222.1 stage 0 sporulation protein B (sporulation initiation phosphotransferase) [Texcoconibacillus texcoconensis]